MSSLKFVKWAVVGMILLFQTPKAVVAVAAISPHDGWIAMYEGFMFSVFMEFILIYFVLNGRRWQAIVSLMGMMIVNYEFYKASILAFNVLGIFVMLAGPFLIWSVTEDVRKADAEHSRKYVEQFDPKVTVQRSKESRIRELLEQGKTFRQVVEQTGASMRMITKVNKERRAA